MDLPVRTAPAKAAAPSLETLAALIRTAAEIPTSATTESAETAPGRPVLVRRRGKNFMPWWDLSWM